MNIENEGESHDVIDNKGQNFLSHDVADNTGTYRDYPTMFMKTKEVSFCSYSLDRAKAVSGNPRPPPYSPKTQNEPEKLFRINKSDQKRTRERTRTNPRIALSR
jgi:hypothetical protein